jgi:DNA topoisomerase III
MASSKPTLAWTMKTILAAANEHFDYPRDEALSALYKLYEAGLITYPRTETAYLPLTLLDATSKLVRKLQHWHRREGVHPKYQGLVWNDAMVGSHHGIVPCKASAVQLGLADLGVAELNMYKLVCERLLELFTPHKA